MQRAYTVFLALVALGTVILAFSINSAQSTVATSQDKALAFIENVLPIDSSQYKVTFKPPFPGFTPIDDRFLVETYSLESKDSSLTFICSFYEGVLYQCQFGVNEGSLVTDQPYANTTEAAKSFLEKYQDYSKLDSTEMIAMLTNVDPTENTTITSGDLKLTVTHKDLTGTWFGDSIGFRWVRVINGCEYLVVNLSFRDGVFAGFIDHRERYSIGDTTVNISKEQAIKIAMEAIKTYSYRMSDDWMVTDFDVKEDQTTANLHPQTKEGNVLYPAWSVILPLNGTYPGSVRELLVGIWAGSGEVYLVHHQAYGGSDLTSDSNSGYIVLDGNSGFEDATTSPSASSSENNEAQMDPNMVAIIAVAMIVIAVATITLLVKKRKE
jgi:hypothetical protein